MEELKPCPFCGGNAYLEHEEIEKCRSRENGDIITKWHVRCPNCGVQKDGGITEYVFNNDETLSIKNKSYDGRARAIAAWNTRAGAER